MEVFTSVYIIVGVVAMMLVRESLLFINLTEDMGTQQKAIILLVVFLMHPLWVMAALYYEIAMSNSWDE